MDDTVGPLAEESFTCDDGTRAAIAVSLGLDGPASPGVVTTAEWVHGRLHVVLATPDGSSSTVLFEPRQPDSRAFILTSGLAISYMGPNLPESIQRVLADSIVPRLRDTPFSELSALLRGDSNRPAPSESAGREADGRPAPRTLCCSPSEERQHAAFVQGDRLLLFHPHDEDVRRATAVFSSGDGRRSRGPTPSPDAWLDDESRAPVGAPQDDAARHGTVILGLPSCEGARGLIRLLRGAGVAVTGQVLPALSREGIRRTREAEHVVVSPGIPWKPLHARLVSSGAQVIAPPAAPYGWKSSCSWLQAVSAALGRSSELERVLAEEHGRRSSEWARLQKRAREHVVGFAVDSDSVERLQDPGASFGVPLLPLVREMGFGVEVFVSCANHATASRTRATLAALDSQDAGITVHASVSHGDHRSALRRASAEALFVDDPDDPRPAALGRAAFSLADFEPGLAGAISTLRRLLFRCQQRQWRQLGAQLGLATDPESVADDPGPAPVPSSAADGATEVSREGDSAPRQSAPDAPSEPPVDDPQSRPSTLAVTFTDRRGRLAPIEFFLVRAEPGDRLFRRRGPVGLAHGEAPPTVAFQSCATLMEVALRRFSRPPGPDTQDAWRRLLTALHARTPLRKRFTLTIDSVGRGQP